MKILKTIIWIFIVLETNSTILQSKDSAKSKFLKNSRQLGLFMNYQEEAEKLQNATQSQAKFLKYIERTMKMENLESKIDQMNQDDLEYFEERKEKMLNKISNVKGKLQHQLREYFTKYVQLPTMGNYSYWDLSKPVTLH
jgi:hypothetical protein